MYRKATIIDKPDGYEVYYERDGDIVNLPLMTKDLEVAKQRVKQFKNTVIFSDDAIIENDLPDEWS